MPRDFALLVGQSQVADERLAVEPGNVPHHQLLQVLRHERGQGRLWWTALHNQLDVVLHLVGVVPQDARVVASHAQSGLAGVDRLVLLLRVQYESGKGIWLAVLKPANETKGGDTVNVRFCGVLSTEYSNAMVNKRPGNDSEPFPLNCPTSTNEGVSSNKRPFLESHRQLLFACCYYTHDGGPNKRRGAFEPLISAGDDIHMGTDNNRFDWQLAVAVSSCPRNRQWGCLLLVVDIPI